MTSTTRSRARALAITGGAAALGAAVALGILAGQAASPTDTDPAAATASPTFERIDAIPADQMGPATSAPLTGTDAGMLPADAGAPLPEDVPAAPVEDVDQDDTGTVPPVVRAPAPSSTATPAPAAHPAPPAPSAADGPGYAHETEGDPCFRQDPESYEPGGPCYVSTLPEPGSQADEERIGGYRCPDPAQVIVRVNPDVCGDPSEIGR